MKRSEFFKLARKIKQSSVLYDMAFSSKDFFITYRVDILRKKFNFNIDILPDDVCVFDVPLYIFFRQWIKLSKFKRLSFMTNYEADFRVLLLKVQKEKSEL